MADKSGFIFVVSAGLFCASAQGNPTSELASAEVFQVLLQVPDQPPAISDTDFSSESAEQIVQYPAGTSVDKLTAVDLFKGQDSDDMPGLVISGRGEISGFGDAGIDLLDGWTDYVGSSNSAWLAASSGAPDPAELGFWSFTASPEMLRNDLVPSVLVIPLPGAFAAAASTVALVGVWQVVQQFLRRRL